jgi:hypothetical protein
MTPNKQVSPVIRISQGERDVSARATHLEAATRKFLVTTNERKQMSSKTNFKRIALVAVAALGMGVLSSAPSQSAVNAAATITTTNGTATVAKSDSTTAATVAVRFFADAGGADTASVTFTFGTSPAAAAAPSVTNPVLVTAMDTALASGAASLLTGKGDSMTAWATPYGTDSVTSNVGKLVIKPGGVGNGYGKFRAFLDPNMTKIAGTYTIDYQVKIYSDGALAPTLGGTGSVNIVVTDGTLAAAGAVTAAGTSTALMSSGASWTTVTADADIAAAATPAGTAVASIQVKQLTSDGSPARESITVTTTIGNLGFNGASATGKSEVYKASTNGIDTITIFSDGTSGTATINIKTTSVTFAPKTVTFYSTTVAKYTVTQLATVIGSSSARAFVVAAVDAQGNVIKEPTNSTVYAYSDNLDAVATGATTSAGQACSAYSSVFGGHVCSLTGSANGDANITIRNKSTSALSTVSATAGKVTVNLNIPAKIALAFDKATYAPGEVAYLTVSATDAGGKPVAPGTYSDLLATGGITSNVAFGNGSASADSMTATSLPFNTATSGKASSTGVYTVKVFMPASGGAIEAYVTGGTALPAAAQVKLTAKATVTDSGAAALAAVTALATQVASLRTLITTLTNLVLKIQKKVRA